MDRFAHRKVSFKTPSGNAADVQRSQEARRQKALEEQKRRRLQRIDSSRNLDLFANLSLGASDDEDDDTPEDTVVREGVGAFVPFLSPTTPSHPSPIPPPASLPSSSPIASSVSPSQASASAPASGGKKSQRRRKGGKKNKKPSKWADKCMYAELLEMNEDDPWNDGIPDDIESGWVALSIPVGKRCLAVTHQSAGISGIVPNTMLRSRLLGKSLIQSFPSPLPPSTVLDCILDENWKDNGVLHVLDIVKWKGQDIAECEASFRFWWRDTRLAELTFFPPPPASVPVHAKTQPTIVANANAETTASAPQAQPPTTYKFAYPTTFLSIPCVSPTPIPALLREIIPAARATRVISVNVPDLSSSFSPSSSTPSSSASFSHASPHSEAQAHAPYSSSTHPASLPPGASASTSFSFSLPHQQSQTVPDDGMQVDPRSQPQSPVQARHPSQGLARPRFPGAPSVSIPRQFPIHADGLLLYVAQAWYEPGTSPLSSWIPIVDPAISPGEGGTNIDAEHAGRVERDTYVEGPLMKFERLIRRRVEHQQNGLRSAMGMHPSGPAITNHPNQLNGIQELTMDS